MLMLFAHLLLSQLGPNKHVHGSPQEKKTFKEEVQVSHGQKDRDGWIVSGLAHIYASFNDTFVNITDLSGKKTDLRRHLSQGQSRRVLPYAAQDVAEKFYLLGITALRINLPKEEMALRAMACSSMKICRIEDVTSIPSDSTRRKLGHRGPFCGTVRIFIPHSKM
ncbi:40S ribosomal protein S14-like [Culex quinquefasciatus]|uniref:40S ribosomal protein S14-like n=1 Tax=Culex quinquefasciatus TaxID=7176 RepID=UPI0018E2F6DE|nr:40S ribosomal protein S14-like [Culex quinquefasciatus]